jgi:hypothetical protein
MTWASRRQAFILSMIAIIVLLGIGVAVFFIATSEKPMTCIDKVQNQDEEGVDCGGVCAYLCSASVAPPSVSFVRAVPSGDRTDIVAYVANRNPDAAVKGARYTLELFGSDRGFIAERAGTIDLPPGAVVPIFAPGMYDRAVEGQAFLTFDDASVLWYREPRVAALPRVEEARIADTNPPRVTALIRNASAFPMDDITLVATVFDASGVPLAASQTLLRSLAPGDTAVASFFWNAPFVGPVGRVEVRPVPWLP